MVTDHKSLVKIFGDRSLDEITNSRLFRLKQRSLSWRFRVVHVPGKSIPASDTFSRHPAQSEYDDFPEWIPSTPSGCVSAGHDKFAYLEACTVAASRASLDAIKVLSWEEVKNATTCDASLSRLKEYILKGFPDKSESMPLDLQPYWKYRERLSIVDQIILYNDRIVVPPPLRKQVCQILHSAHQGTNAMRQRAQATVFWPGITQSIDRARADCANCSAMAPSQAHLPPTEPFIPTYPFQAIAADYCTVAGQQYLIAVDRFSNWPEIHRIKPGSSESGALGLQALLRGYFATFGVVEEISSDGGPEFTAYSTQEFLRKWGVRHRLSSAYNARSNGRAEVCVKSMKRLIQNNVSHNGNTLTDAFTIAVLQYRNCPDPDNGLSPAEIVFGRTLKDALPRPPQRQIFDDTRVRPIWRSLWRERERTLRTRFARQLESLQLKTKPLLPLPEGDACRIQNQWGRFPLRWDKTGVVLQCRGNDQYLIKVDGSRRLTLRNRKYLRKVEPLCRPLLVNRQLSSKAVTPRPSLSDVPPHAPPADPVSAAPEQGQSAPPDGERDAPAAVPASEDTFADVVRRSARLRKPPAWHQDYHIGTFSFR